MAQLMKSLWKHFPAWFVGLFALLLLTYEIIFYNHETFGFAIYGPAVFIPTIFPIIWVGLYIIGNRSKAKELPKSDLKVQEQTPGEKN